VSDEDDDRIPVVARALLNYLEQHPGSADTKEGITRWWVLEQHLVEQMELVEAALNDLQQRGLVECSNMAGRIIYRAAGHDGDHHG
jgi:hypothetical protein